MDVLLFFSSASTAVSTWLESWPLHFRRPCLELRLVFDTALRELAPERAERLLPAELAKDLTDAERPLPWPRNIRLGVELVLLRWWASP